MGSDLRTRRAHRTRRRLSAPRACHADAAAPRNDRAGAAWSPKATGNILPVRRRQTRGHGRIASAGAGMTEAPGPTCRGSASKRPSAAGARGGFPKLRAELRNRLRKRVHLVVRKLLECHWRARMQTEGTAQNLELGMQVCRPLIEEIHKDAGTPCGASRQALARRKLMHCRREPGTRVHRTRPRGSC